MLPAPAKRSSAFLPALWACILAAAGFLIGRLSVGVSPSSKACPELGTDAQDPRLSSLQSDDVQTRSSGIDADGSWHPVAKDWEEIAERAGLLQGRPLLPTGYNGKSEYVIQPFQVRAARCPLACAQMAGDLYIVRTCAAYMLLRAVCQMQLGWYA